MFRLSPSALAPLVTVVVACLVLPLAAAGQTGSPVSSRVLGRLHGDGVDVPRVRLLFYQEDTGETCVGLGIKEGPNPMRPGFIVFQTRPGEGEGKAQRLKFEFDKKKVKTEGGLRLWTSCLSKEDVELGPGAEIQVTVRRPRRDTQAFVVEFPPSGMANGIDLWQNFEGRLESRERSQNLGGG